MLALVVCGIVLGLAYPFRTYLGQRAELERLQVEAEQRTARVSALEEQIARYDDPAFVASEARRRQHLVYPGETLYTILDPAAPAAEEAQPEPRSGVPPLRQQAPWWGQLWHSAQGTDAAPVEPSGATE